MSLPPVGWRLTSLVKKALKLRKVFFCSQTSMWHSIVVLMCQSEKWPAVHSGLRVLVL